MVVSFIKHQLTAKTRHGIHSPFVYQLIDEVIYDYNKKKEYNVIENLREQLLQNQDIISITDLGAGSHINNNRQKKISSIAKNALKSPKLAKLLHRLVVFFKPATVIELGTCLGITTAYLASASPQSKVITMEGCPQTAGVAKNNLQKLGLQNVELITGNFDDEFPKLINALKQVDFVFVDGNHRRKATMDYFELCLPKVHENSVLIFDDIYWSQGMKEAWQEIKNHPQVTLTIDLFWIGLVFFKKRQEKEHFKVKF